MLNQILCTGGFTVGLCIFFLKWEPLKQLFRYSTKPIYWMTAFFALFIFCGIFNCFNARTQRLNLCAYLYRNPAFVLILTLITAVQLGLIYYGGSLFRTAGLTISELIRVLALSALVIPFDLLRKSCLRLFGRKGVL
jgi:magnesium-transporting ATPase (P-type)